nr:hypothetical protein [Moritella viscosa]SHO15135.1 Putative uncharacterized protein [Moritella viscosa]
MFKYLIKASFLPIIISSFIANAEERYVVQINKTDFKYTEEISEPEPEPELNLEISEQNGNQGTYSVKNGDELKFTGSSAFPTLYSDNGCIATLSGTLTSGTWTYKNTVCGNDDTLTFETVKGESEIVVVEDEPCNSSNGWIAASYNDHNLILDEATCSMNGSSIFSVVSSDPIPATSLKTVELNSYSTFNERVLDLSQVENIFDNTTSLFTITDTPLEQIKLDSLVQLDRFLNISRNHNLTNFNLPKLTSFKGGYGGSFSSRILIEDNKNLTSISLNKLTSVNQLEIFFNQSLSSFSVSSLVSSEVQFFMTPENMSIDLSSLEKGVVHGHQTTLSDLSSIRNFADGELILDEKALKLPSSSSRFCSAIKSRNIDIEGAMSRSYILDEFCY